MAIQQVTGIAEPGDQVCHYPPGFIAQIPDAFDPFRGGGRLAGEVQPHHALGDGAAEIRHARLRGLPRCCIQQRQSNSRQSPNRP